MGAGARFEFVEGAGSFLLRAIRLDEIQKSRRRQHRGQRLDHSLPKVIANGANAGKVLHFQIDFCFAYAAPPGP